MAFEYLASVQSAVRRFNYRMETLSANLGQNSPIIEGYKAKMDVLFPDNYRLKDGVPQLMKPQEIYNNPDLNQWLENIDEEVPTWGGLKKEFEGEYEKYKEQEQFFRKEPVPISSFISSMISLPDAIKYLYPTNTEDKKKAVEIMKEKGRRKTYAELQEVIRLSGV